MRRIEFRTTPLAVKPHNPRGRSIVTALAGLVAVTAIAGAYFYGEYRGGYQRWIVQARHEQLIHERDALAKTNADLRQQLVFLKRSRQIDREAQEQVQQTNTNLQAQIVDLKKKLSFYNDIVAPGKVHSGVRVQALEVVAGEQAHRYRYNLVLMQGPRHDRETTGTVKVTVIGQQNAEPVTLDRKFKFRFFENLRGDLQLPAGFTPERIEVTVTQSGDRDDPFKRSFDWQVTG
ncbi:MAG TPA: DUF6776 family protein [Gammaproteobacteria bacterium]|nr:DUF6776 family protein [Gammaproteobacteria bacterium]HET7586795.1 DUF6776 family protein [Gammaproteobacteria bacterium]